MAEATPSAPSYRPPSLTESRCEPIMIFPLSGFVPFKVPITFPTVSMCTSRSSFSNIPAVIWADKKYSSEKGKFFKKDSLCMIVSQNINLAGFALCGLLYENDQPIKTYKVNLKLYEVDDANNFNKDSKEMFSIDVDIPTITNIIDPVYQFYLNMVHLHIKELMMVMV